jgi:iron complex outermembrane receptor protein
LPPPVEILIRANAPPQLSNNLDGSNILAQLSYTNFGQVDTQGIDIGLNYYFLDPWKLAFSYSWFDFQPQENVPPGFDPLLAPNSPENTFQLGLAYLAERWGVDFAMRWVDDFRWSVGIFQGDVMSYTTVDLSANFSIVENWTIGANISNLFNNKHYESFGGDLIRRRALAYVAFDWQ